MTKQRAPLSIDTALARIAGQLPDGWKDMARLVNRSESVVRKWGDEDQPEQISFNAAIKLDIAYQKAGGSDCPLFETFALQVQVAREVAFAGEVELARRLCAIIREGSEAQEMMVRATMPDATPATRKRALRELQDVAREVTGAIALLSAEIAPDTS